MCAKYLVNKMYLGARELGYELWTGKEIVEMTSKEIKDSIKAGDEIYGLSIAANGELELDRKNYFMTNVMEKRHIGNLRPMYETDSRANVFYLVTGSRMEKDVQLYEMVSSRFERLEATKEKLEIMFEMGLINGGVKIENGTIMLPQMEKKAAEEKKATEEKKAAEEKKASEEKETASEEKEPTEKKEAAGEKKAPVKKKEEPAKEKDIA